MNEAEIEIWNGPVGERWALYQTVLDAHIGPFGQAMLAAAELVEGARVLDVGCGCGATTIAAAARVGDSGIVVGVDVSRPMLGRARERTKELANVRLVEADAATFVSDEPFDVAISRFGVMFFEDPVAGFASVRRATRPGGRLAFVCWRAMRENPWATLPLEAILGAVPEAADGGAAALAIAEDAPGPWALADRARLEVVLARAGWEGVAVSAFDHPMRLGATLDDALEFASRVGPGARALRDAPEDARPRAMSALRDALAPLGPTFELAGAAWIVTARAST